jgi:hypothetical protein
MLFHKPIEDRPWNRLQKFMKNDILVSHGISPLGVQMIRNQLKPSRINAVRFFKQKSCQTAVGLTWLAPPAGPKPLRRGEGPGIHVFGARGTTWVAGTSPAMTNQLR